MGLRIVAVVCLLALSVRATDLTLEQLEASIKWDADKYGSVVFKIIEDPNDADQHIKHNDLTDDYYLDELTQEASDKFLKVIDSNDADTWVDENEMKAYFKKPQVKLALYECIPIKSQTLENLCLRDQLLSYVLLVLDELPKGAVHEFFDYMEDDADPDQFIKVEDLNKVNIKDAVTQQNMLRELSGGTGCDVDLAKFTHYVTHEDLGPHFRECKKNGVKDQDTGLADYDEKCLLDELVVFVNHHLTELDMAGVFNWLDKNDNGFVTPDELDSMTGAKAGSGAHLVKIIEEDGDNQLHYGEFRAFFRQSYHYRKVLTKGCTMAEQAQQEECYKTNVKTLVQSRPHLKLIHLPDLDIIFIFEDLDTNNDGKILGVGKKWSDAKAMANLVAEADSLLDDDKDVDLDELMGYTKNQNFVYGIGDCMSINDGDHRLPCYQGQYMKMMGNILLKKDAAAFFDWYEADDDNDNDITKEDLKKKCTDLDDARITYYLKELGMGDEVVTYEEFEWFVRQEEFLLMIVGKHSDHQAMHIILITYIEEHMTEYDIQELFLDLDETEPHMELTQADFAKDEDCKGKDATALIKAMDTHTLLGLPEPDTSVNFYEWWLFFMTPIDAPRRDKHFDQCAKDNKSQDLEIDCYKNKLFDASIY